MKKIPRSKKFIGPPIFLGGLFDLEKTMPIKLFEHQRLAISRMKNGCILCGGVGSGKSRTSLVYFYTKVCDGELKINGVGKDRKPKKTKDLYIITTAKKRDSLEWEQELLPFRLSVNEKDSICNIKVSIDSWNNIKKYSDVTDSMFIFDEQRVVGKGSWVKNFLNISKHNEWILLSATPGDTWMDYIPVFIANGFYKNRTEFIRRHVIFNRFVKFPKVDRYVECGRLIKLRQSILVNMRYVKKTESHHIDIIVEYDSSRYSDVIRERWNIFENQPIKNISEYCFVVRRIVNSSENRIERTKELIKENPKVIIFYNYNYELDILKKIGSDLKIEVSEWNGHKHDQLPNGPEWIYLVQYSAGSEGWNCTTTNTVIFYSQNYSYRATAQASGRIDRLNTPFSDLYYYHLYSDSPIDKEIKRALSNKKDFNESGFAKKEDLYL